MNEESISLLGYGSLMSGFGLRRLGRLGARGVRRVALGNARRGFGKASLHGDRYAMVLEAVDAAQPLAVVPLRRDEPGGAEQGILFALEPDDLARVASREGYSAEAFARLVALAGASAVSPAAYLCDLLAAAHGDAAGFRRRLCDRLGYTSAHYVPHPVNVAGAPPALTFLAPGREGSGHPDVVPVRVATQRCELLDIATTWRAKPNQSQLEYFAMCLLAGAHGVRVDDVAAGLDADEELTQALRDCGCAHAALEVERFCDTLGLSAAAYAAFAAPPDHLYSRLFNA